MTDRRASGWYLRSSDVTRANARPLVVEESSSTPDNTYLSRISRAPAKAYVALSSTTSPGPCTTAPSAITCRSVARTMPGNSRGALGVATVRPETAAVLRIHCSTRRSPVPVTVSRVYGRVGPHLRRGFDLGRLGPQLRRQPGVGRVVADRQHHPRAHRHRQRHDNGRHQHASGEDRRVTRGLVRHGPRDELGHADVGLDGLGTTFFRRWLRAGAGQPLPPRQDVRAGLPRAGGTLASRHRSALPSFWWTRGHGRDDGEVLVAAGGADVRSGAGDHREPADSSWGVEPGRRGQALAGDDAQ